MALEVYWYDFVCFGIVGVSLCGALWVIWRKEGSSRSEDTSGTTSYESLLQAASPAPVSEVFVPNVGATGHISSDQLWSSCWRGVHPKWLLATRFLSFLLMSGVLAWDVLEWNASIFVYYTEYVTCYALLLPFFIFFGVLI